MALYQCRCAEIQIWTQRTIVPTLRCKRCGTYVERIARVAPAEPLPEERAALEAMSQIAAALPTELPPWDGIEDAQRELERR